MPLSLRYSYVAVRLGPSTYTTPHPLHLTLPVLSKEIMPRQLSSLRGVVDVIHDGDGAAALLNRTVSSLRRPAAHPPSLPVHQEGYRGQAGTQTGNHHHHQKPKGTGNRNGRGYDGGR